MSSAKSHEPNAHNCPQCKCAKTLVTLDAQFATYHRYEACEHLWSTPKPRSHYP
jgi:hypothetical protein